MNKVKAFFKRNRLMITTFAMAACFSLMCCAGAVDESTAFDLAGTMTTSVTTIVNNLLSMITKVVPVTVTLLAAAIGINYGIRFIKRLIGKAG